MTTRRVIINNDTDSKELFGIFDERLKYSPQIRIKANDSILMRDFRRLQRRSRSLITADADLLLTGLIPINDLPVDTLCWGATYSLSHITPDTQVGLNSHLKYEYTGPAYSMGSVFSDLTNAAGKFDFVVPTAGAVIATSIGNYTLDIYSIISSINVFLVQDFHTEINFEQPHSAASLLLDQGDSTIDLSMVNATSAVHLVSIEPATTGSEVPDTPISVIGSTVAANSCVAGSTVTIDIPSVASEAVGAYYVTVKKSAATPVTILNSHLVKLQ